MTSTYTKFLLKASKRLDAHLEACLEHFEKACGAYACMGLTETGKTRFELQYHSHIKGMKPEVDPDKELKECIKQILCEAVHGGAFAVYDHYKIPTEEIKRDLGNKELT